jgi:hypothetical protein
MVADLELPGPHIIRDDFEEDERNPRVIRDEGSNCWYVGWDETESCSSYSGVDRAETTGKPPEGAVVVESNASNVAKEEITTPADQEPSSATLQDDYDES